ncbi:MAG: hypothetical protein ACWGNV_16050 [Bacteroidales bacterium]
MYLDVYIASPDVPGFSWKQSDSSIEPKKIGPFVPESREAFFLLRDKMEEGIYEYIMTDWATWVAKVSKQQIIDFFTELYGDGFMHWEPEDVFEGKQKADPYSKRPHIDIFDFEIDAMVELIQLIQGLDESKVYALVAQEY